MKHLLPTLVVLALAGTAAARIDWAEPNLTPQRQRAQWAIEQTAIRMAPQAPEPVWETLIDENFDKMTAGTQDAPDPMVLTDDEGHYVDEDLTTLPGWSGIGVRQAGGTVNVGTPKYGTCILNTPLINMTGYLHLSFRAKCLEEVKGFTVNLDYDNIVTPKVQSQPGGGKVSANDNGWRHFDFYFYNPQEADCFLQIVVSTYGNTNGIIIDDYKLERTHDYIAPVTAMECYDFTMEGFSAAWRPEAKATSYLVSLYGERTVGAENQNIAYDLAGVAEDENYELSGLPEGISMNYRRDRSHVGTINDKPAVTLDKEDEFIEINAPGRITNLTFTYQPIIGENESAGFSQFNVQGFDGVNWVTLQAFGDYGSEEPQNMDFGAYIDEVNEEMASQGGDVINFHGEYSRLRIVPESVNYGLRMCFNNIAVVSEPTVETEALVADRPEQTNECAFTDIDTTDPDMRYFVGVKSVNGEYVSKEF